MLVIHFLFRGTQEKNMNDALMHCGRTENKSLFQEEWHILELVFQSGHDFFKQRIVNLEHFVIGSTVARRYFLNKCSIQKHSNVRL